MHQNEQDWELFKRLFKFRKFIRALKSRLLRAVLGKKSLDRTAREICDLLSAARAKLGDIVVYYLNSDARSSFLKLSPIYSTR